jgi:hypothetical protein
LISQSQSQSQPQSHKLIRTTITFYQHAYYKNQINTFDLTTTISQFHIHINLTQFQSHIISHTLQKGNKNEDKLHRDNFFSRKSITHTPPPTADRRSQLTPPPAASPEVTAIGHCAPHRSRLPHTIPSRRTPSSD